LKELKEKQNYYKRVIKDHGINLWLRLKTIRFKDAKHPFPNQNKYLHIVIFSNNKFRHQNLKKIRELNCLMHNVNLKKIPSTYNYSDIFKYRTNKKIKKI
jgi:hypothetical protein